MGVCRWVTIALVDWQFAHRLCLTESARFAVPNFSHHSLGVWAGQSVPAIGFHYLFDSILDLLLAEVAGTVKTIVLKLIRPLDRLV